MRLLDLIAQSSPSQSRPAPNGPSPHEFAQAVRACPLRLVLADDVTRRSTALAYAGANCLSGCVDLVEVPSERLWVEWAEAPRLQVLSAVSEKPIQGEELEGRAGVLIDSDASGRTGTIRSFCSARDDSVYCAELIAEFDLNLPIRGCHSVADVFNGEAAAVSLSEEPALDTLLSHCHFRFDPAWLAYYRSANLSSDEQAKILCAALGVTAFIVPMLLVVFSLLSATDGAEQRAVKLDRLNRIRRRSGKAELLEHVEVATTIQWQRNRGSPTSRASDR